MLDYFYQHIPSDVFDDWLGAAPLYNLFDMFNGRTAETFEKPNPHKLDDLSRIMIWLLSRIDDLHWQSKLNGKTVEEHAKEWVAIWLREFRPLPGSIGGFGVYVQALKESGYDISVDDDGDIVWPAEEQLRESGEGSVA